MKQQLRQSIASFEELPPVRRYCLLAGGLLVLMLALVLLSRPLRAVWQDARQWQTLARQVQNLTPAVVFSNEQWQALAVTGQLVLTQVERQGDVWRVQGELPRPQALTQLMRTLQEQGGRPLRWSLKRGAQSYVFSLDVAGTTGSP